MFEETRDGEQRETIYELSDLLLVAQEMGQRLANDAVEKVYS